MLPAQSTGSLDLSLPAINYTRMVKSSVPNNYTFSPSSAEPHLTINHDVVADLDSSNAFEGVFRIELL